MTKHFEYSLANGFNRVRHGDLQALKRELDRVLGVGNPTCRFRRYHHYRDIPHHVYVEVTELFGRYGVAEGDVWTMKECSGHGKE